MVKLVKPYAGPNNTIDGVRVVRDSREIDGTRYQSGEAQPLWLPTMVYGVFTLIFIIFIGLSINVAFAQSPQIFDRQTGKYLGNLNSNQFDPNSVSNQFGRYGSQFSNDSINNKFGTYGSPFSNKSVNNPWATQSPVIVAPTGRWGN